MFDLASPDPTRLHDEQGQSPWLDDLTRGCLSRGELSRWVAAGVRGVTSNPTGSQRAFAALHGVVAAKAAALAGRERAGADLTPWPTAAARHGRQ